MEIKRASLDDFLEGAELRLVSYDDESIFKRSGTSHARESLPASQVTEMAETYAMNPDEWEDYDFVISSKPK